MRVTHGHGPAGRTRDVPLPLAFALAVVALSLAAAPSMGADIESLEVTRDGGQFEIQAVFRIAAPTPDVYAALLEYDRFDELSDSFTDSRYIEPTADGLPRIYTKIEGCIWFFCRKIERFAYLELEPPTKVTAVTEPELSDAEMSVESWLLSPLGEATQIDYRHELQTGFWVPPLIGTWVIRRAISSSALDAAERIETLAQEAVAARRDAEPPQTLNSKAGTGSPP